MRMVAVLVLVIGLFVQSAGATQNVVKEPEGKTIAVILDCSSCQAEKKAGKCESGIETGFHDGKPCGSCLLKANFGAAILSPYDLVITGRLRDEEGKPVTKKFVRLFMSNNWTVRTRTSDEGVFVLRLGATAERKGKKPLLVDLGERTMRSDSKAAQYALFMLREDHKPCEK